ncbi:MAG: hypothetical protein ACOVKB_05305, partial [Silanimonas sp.]
MKSYLSAIRTTILLVVLTLAGLASGTASAQEDRRVRIINETNHTIVRFFGSNAGTTDWEEDILGDKV